MSKELVVIIQHGLAQDNSTPSLETLAAYSPADKSRYLQELDPFQAKFEQVATGIYRSIVGARKGIKDAKHLRALDRMANDLDDLRASVWGGASPHYVALTAGNLFCSLYGLLTENDPALAAKFLSAERRAARSARTDKANTALAQALASIELSIDNGEHPRWTHADFAFDPIIREKYHPPVTPLLEGVKELFKKKSLFDRIGQPKFNPRPSRLARA